MRLLFLPAVLVAASGGRHERSPAADLEVVAELPVGDAGNITVTPDNQISNQSASFLFAGQKGCGAWPWRKAASVPNASWNAGDLSTDHSFDSVLGIQCNRKGVVWMLDNGLRSGSIPRLVGLDTATVWPVLSISARRPFRVNGYFRTMPFLTGFAVDLRTKSSTFPTAQSRLAVIVVDLQSGKARRVLQGHACGAGEYDIVMNGKALNFTLPDAGRLEALIGVNPIALDSSDEWLDYGTVNGRSMYRIRTSVFVMPV